MFHMFHSTYLRVLCIVVLFTASCLAGNWRQFRGPGGLGVSDEKNLPIEWGPNQNILWKTEMPGDGSSSPIVLGDRVFVTCYSGYGNGQRNSGGMQDLRLHVVCVNRADGKIIWDKELQPRLPESQRVRDHGYAGPTPTTDGERLYVFFGKSGLFAFDLQGNQLWNADVGTQTHGWGCGTSPVLYKNLVIVNASVESGSLVAVDKITGEEAWRSPGMRASWNTPHLVKLKDGKQELVVSVRSSILGFDPATGTQLWTCEGVPDYVCPSVVSQADIVYAIGGRRSVSMAIRAGGRGDVTDTHKLWETTAGSNVCSPVIHKGHLYWISDRNRAAYCLNLEDGRIVYRKRFPSQPYASAVQADDKLYIVTRRGGTYVLAAKPEYKELAHNTLDDRSTFNASPAISDGNLFLRSDRYLYCIGAKL